MTESVHSARSSEFLSLLHDGEIPPPERRTFENHCATCPECRAAVEEYERTLSLYRASAVAPAPSDLSARILRKIRAQAPSRRPFGVTFGIDIRWAGALIAALLVVLVSAPLLLRREAVPSEEPASHSIPAHLLDAAPASTGADAAAPQIRSGNESGRSPEEPGQRPANSEPSAGPAEEAEPRRQASEKARPPAAAPMQTVATEDAAALSKDEAAASRMASREASSNRPAAPEAAMPASTEGKLQGRANRLPPRLSVRALDGGSPSPALLASPPDDRLASLRGLAFVVIVQPNGTVSEVLPAAPEPAPRRPAPGNALVGPDASVLLEIRFEAGSQARRLLLRID
jgi:hypothetical protein